MHLFYLIGGLCLLEYSFAISFTNTNYNGIQVGVPFNLTWEGAQGAVVLGLLFRANASSPQNSTIIASGITECQFTWIPPDGTATVIAQEIEAQDAKNNFALTGNFTIAKAATPTSSIQPISNAVATTISSSSTTMASSSEPTSSSFASQNTGSVTKKENTMTTRIRIGFGICIVVVLVIIGGALIFFERGKRVAAKSEQQQVSKPAFDGAERRDLSMELMERGLEDQKIVRTETKEDEPATPLLYKPYRKPKSVIELDGAVMDKAKKIMNAETEEERKRRILSVRSIYELG